MTATETRTETRTATRTETQPETRPETRPTGTGPETDDIAAVRDVLHCASAAWAAGDADAFAALYLDDATVVMPGVLHRGRAALRGSMADAFAGRLKGSRGVDDPRDVRILGDDTAIVVGRGGIVLADEESVPAERERFATWVLARQGGRWQIAAYANTPAH
jgi:uncharacterized protein (TIGR02246 family)